MQQPEWEEQPDGSRVLERPGSRVEHLVTWQEDGGRTIVMGLDAACRPVDLTTLYGYL